MGWHSKAGVLTHVGKSSVGFCAVARPEWLVVAILPVLSPLACLRHVFRQLSKLWDLAVLKIIITVCKQSKVVLHLGWCCLHRQHKLSMMGTCTSYALIAYCFIAQRHCGRAKVSAHELRQGCPQAMRLTGRVLCNFGISGDGFGSAI